jgi:hypothetical protein
MRIFKLDTAVDGYTHGRVHNEQREHDSGMLVVHFYYGKLLVSGFVPSILGSQGQITLSPDDMTDFLAAATLRPADLPAYEFRTEDVIEFLPTLKVAREARAAAAAAAAAEAEAAAAVAAEEAAEAEEAAAAAEAAEAAR